jgi:hypothetical protein
LRGDPVTRSQFYTAMHAIQTSDGVPSLTVNEIRERENLPPLDGGDEELEPDDPIEPTDIAEPPATNGNAPSELPAEFAPT